MIITCTVSFIFRMFQAIENEMIDKQPIKESVEASAAKLTELCDEDVDEVNGKIEDLNKIWNEMDEEKSNKEEELKRLSTDLSEYKKLANAVEEKVTKVEKALPNEAALEEGNLLRREGGASVAQSSKPRPPTTEVLGLRPVSNI